MERSRDSTCTGTGAGNRPREEDSLDSSLKRGGSYVQITTTLAHKINFEISNKFFFLQLSLLFIRIRYINPGIRKWLSSLNL